MTTTDILKQMKEMWPYRLPKDWEVFSAPERSVPQIRVVVLGTFLDRVHGKIRRRPIYKAELRCPDGWVIQSVRIDRNRKILIMNEPHGRRILIAGMKENREFVSQRTVPIPVMWWTQGYGRLVRAHEGWYREDRLWKRRLSKAERAVVLLMGIKMPEWN